MSVQKLEGLCNEVANKLESANTEADIFNIKSAYIGKKSIVSDILKGLRDLSIEEKKIIGGLANKVKGDISNLIDSKLTNLEDKVDELNLDITLPGHSPHTGHIHPLQSVSEDIISVFAKMGFSVAHGPEVETDWYNFEALNLPPHHPARDMQDTFHISKKTLLRTHTSPVQIRLMENEKPPIRSIMPGRVYRNEEVSSRSYCLFHQIEGLYIDKGVSFADLKGTVNTFIRSFFGSSVKTKFRPSYFPFTEPSAEMDIQCFLCGSKGCSVCKHTGWLEIGGCGMVDPNVFGFTGIDTNVYSGFAFGMGIDRIAMLKYGVDDIRLFFENDVRFLQQF